MKEIIQDYPVPLVGAAVVLLGCLGLANMSDDAVVETHETGESYVRTVEHEFGSSSVLTATMSRDVEQTYTEYVYMEIEGMPCIKRSGGHRGGISCDWSKWKGKTFDESQQPIVKVTKAPVKVELPFFAKDEYPSNVVSRDQPIMTPYASGERVAPK